ncbi:hypothetical protein BY458DRAFT_532364 [Sporodiniella umbellata]|nr:hypothetical protein BY458DRAFT_532364 [Sporodiniella umbellata]
MVDSDLFPCTHENCTDAFKNQKTFFNHINKNQYKLNYSSNPDFNDKDDVVHIPLPGCPSYEDSLPIEPMALIEDNESPQKAEYNTFTHAANIQRMTSKRFISHPIVPAKRKLRKSSSDEILVTTFSHLIHSSPLRGVLLQRQYFEVNHQVCLMLNSDWKRMPNIKYASGHAVLVNTLEAYCRLRSVDIHRELSNQHESIPPPMSYYEDVWPCVLTTSDGEKLTIGTQTMNALITSTIRLDIREEPKVGPTTCMADFRSKIIRIYINHAS